MDYTSALRQILGLIDLERFQGPPGPRVKFDLGRMSTLLASLGDPHWAIPAVHVAGTKGKGSTTAMVTSVLAARGYTVGMYTSPHLHTFRERIAVNGEPIGEEEFAALVQEVWPHLDAISVAGESSPVTLFEALTAMASLHFLKIGADFQVLEVGLGGRLDSTNLVRPEVCAITSISRDHTAILGDTLKEIAAEKAGIIKAGVPVVCAPQGHEALEVIRRVCRESGSDIIEVGRDVTWEGGDSSLEGQHFTVRGVHGRYDLWTPLLGQHQLENAATAVAVAEILTEQGWDVTPEALKTGLGSVTWPCRMEVLGREPLTVVDGAHNPYSMKRLCQSLTEYFSYRRPVVVFGASQGKELEEMVEALVPLRPLVVVTRSRHPRSVDVASLARVFEARGLKAQSSEDVAEAMEKARALAGPEDLVLATGSLFVAAEVREVVLGLEPELYPQLDWMPSVPGAGGSI